MSNRVRSRRQIIAQNPFLQFFWSLAFAALFAFLVVSFGFRSYHVFGQSMEPTLSEGNLLIISKLGVTWAGVTGDTYMPQRGDIIVLTNPLNDTRLIKRVIALGGERITVNGGVVRVFNADSPDGFDPYAEIGINGTFVEGSINQIVPEGHVYVIGDNHTYGGSSDSRNELGPVPTDQVIGKLVLRIWPPGQTQTF